MGRFSFTGKEADLNFVQKRTTTSKVKHTRHFLSYIIFIADLSAILIGTIL